MDRELDGWIAIDVGDQSFVWRNRVDLAAIGDRLVRQITNGGKGELRLRIGLVSENERGDTDCSPQNVIVAE